MGIQSSCTLNNGTIIYFEQSNTPIGNFCNNTTTTVINGTAYTKTDIKSIVFGDSYLTVTSIGTQFLFPYSGLTSLNLVGLSNVTTIGPSFLYQCSILPFIDLSPLSKVTSIGSSFLTKCSGLTSVDLSPLSKVTSIGSNFLYQAYKLTSIDLSPLSKVTVIGNNFLAYCSWLTSVDLSPLSKITTIGYGFLYDCSGLTSINFGNWNIPTFGENSFLNVKNLPSNTLYADRLEIIQKLKTNFPENFSNWGVVTKEWARQDKLNIKLGGSISINPRVDYWPTKKEIIDNWGAEVTGTYVDNQWVDINNVLPGEIYVYKRIPPTTGTPTFYSEISPYELFRGITSDRYDICLVGPGGNGGNWGSWGSGIGGPGGGGIVMSILDAKITAAIWDRRTITSKSATNYIIHISAGITPATAFANLASAGKYDNTFNTQPFIGGNGGNGTGTNTGPESEKNTNGTAGLGCGGVVIRLNYDASGKVTPNPTTITEYDPSLNTAIRINKRGEAYSYNMPDPYALGIPEFGESYLKHAAPGTYAWNQTVGYGFPSAYKTGAIFGYGNGSQSIMEPGTNQTGGRGGGGFGGGGGGKDFESRSTDKFTGSPGGVIVRYKAKRIFPRDRYWKIDLAVMIPPTGFVQTEKTKLFGIVFEGNRYIWGTKHNGVELVNGSVLSKHDLVDNDVNIISIEHTIPDDFEVSRIWLAYANSENDTIVNHMIFATDKPELPTKIINHKIVSSKRISSDYTWNATASQGNRYQPDNRAIQYLDITDSIISNMKINNLKINDYLVPVIILKQYSTMLDVIPTVGRVVRYIDRMNTGIDVKLIGGELITGKSMERFYPITVNPNVYNYDPEYSPNAKDYLFSFWTVQDTMLYYDAVEGSTIGGVTGDNVAKNGYVFVLTLIFDVPTGYKLNFEYYSQSFTSLVHPQPTIQITNNIVAIESKLDVPVLNPNTDVYASKAGAILGEFWISKI